MATASPTRTKARTAVRPDLDEDTSDVPEFEAGTAEVTPDPEDRIPLFRVDGVTYSMPRVVDAGESIRLLHRIRTRGLHEAYEVQLERMVGPEGVVALMNSKGFNKERWNAVVGPMIRHVYGALETAPKAKS